MKTNHVSRIGRLVLAGAVALAAAACDDKKTPDEVVIDSKPLRVEQIIVSPKAASFGDTLVMTADVRSSSGNPGDIPEIKWSADGGSFVESNRLTVEWVAPASTGIYAITVKAKNTTNTATGKAGVFVGVSSTLVATQAGAVRLVTSGVNPSFYYLQSPDLSKGMQVYRFAAGTPGDAAPPTIANTFDITFAPDLSFEAHYADTTFPAPTSVKPRNVYVGWLNSNTFQRISVDLADPTSPKRHQFSAPSISPNGHLVAYQGSLQSPDGAAIDSFHVFVYDLVQNTRLKVTDGQQYPRNFFPTFSTDQQWLTFVSDPVGIGEWEIYGAPVTGDVVDGDLTDLKRLSNTGGSIASGAPASVKNPLKRWNPTASILAVVATDATLYLIQTSASGGTTTDVAGLSGSPAELAWSPDGSNLAVVVGSFTAQNVDHGGGIFLVAGAGASPLYSVPSGDAVRDIAWSPDGLWLVCRRTRGVSSWFELVDVGAGRLPSPIPITSAGTAGDAATYRARMSLSPEWATDNILYIPAFGVVPGATTPGIITRDVSGAVQ